MKKQVIFENQFVRYTVKWSENETITTIIKESIGSNKIHEELNMARPQAEAIIDALIQIYFGEDDEERYS